MPRPRTPKDDKPAPTPLQLAGLLWRVVWPVIARLLGVIAFVVVMSLITLVATRACGK